ncbi:histidine kinase [Subsaximicrobium wynnwilliamsii]|uniref:Histidine kinase n=1 Tax=Subsaximicrobium wynnwilliamsii TaxID=291179 RepID=A0A5C6ZIZ2_9FLAO|nr:sensor histidine kinase [Subsaximicrobium wynnwilliamsii]TXD84536.1 histidine kinase [Subsaximicrobium wynnwilliamsii]TXD90218.1 histidine kinase [Subsaximicrobium wynnwilliamsii]TXE04269.1 histidine kinase [Subsaximicrobium wynnwilliamsii]
MKIKPQITKPLKRTLRHILFWSLILLFFTSIFGVGNTFEMNVFYFSLFLMPVTIGATYVSIYKLLPDYLISKRYFLFGLYSIYALIILVLTAVFSIFFALAYLTNFKFEKMTVLSKSSVFIIISICLVVIVVSAFKLLKLNLKQSKNSAELEAKILEARLKLKEQELKYLKMQIHPHFLFNTLNSIYGLALKKAEQTPDMILKLSNLLDYLLYQTEKPLVAITEEIDHIKDYISLEKMRFNDTLRVTMDVKLKSEHMTTAPMLLLPFIENSFKHGSLKDGVLKIDIDIKVANEVLYFRIKNSISDHTLAQGGIGLENIKKRLDLLYPNKHELSIVTTDDNFEVYLELKTTANV